MKNLKFKLLSLGVLVIIVMPSTPTFATTNTGTSNTSKSITISNKVNVSSNIASIVKPEVNWWGPNGGPDAGEIIDEGGVLQLGDEGKAVHDIQQALIYKGYSVSNDGIYGPQTKAAVKQFQTDVTNSGHYLEEDGIVGSDTLKFLMP